MEYKGFTYTPTPKTAWDNLSMLEKSEMMRVAVRNGITDLKIIKEKYNEFAEGGKIHIKDSKKGTFTAAAKKHGMSVQEFASKVLAHPENYSPAMRKKANFARNASHWKHGLGGNLFEDGGLLDWIKGIFSSENDKPAKEPVYRGSPAEKITIFSDGKKYSAYAPKRINGNNSKTKTQSERLENRMRATIRMDQTKGASDPAYDIPYLPEKSILINGSTTSTNVLDSLAKYAGMHNSNPQLSQYPIRERNEYKEPRRISKDEMLGLAAQETSNGAMPYFNFQKRQPAYNRALANSNYLTAFGSIPAEYLVRNYQYNDAGVDRSTPPLLDAFRYYAQGDYNRKDRKHRADVTAKGREAWKNPNVKEWWDESGKYWYDKGAGNK